MATLRAYLTPGSIHKPHELYSLPPEKLAEMLCYHSEDMSEFGWIEVGSASVTPTLKPLDETTRSAVAVLRKQVQDIRAEAEGKAMRLEREIRQLEALTFDSEAA